MKKFLLSLAAMALGVTAMNAESIVLCVNDFTAIDGTEVAEKPAEGTSTGQAKHYQPLNSLSIGDWKFTFSKASGSTDPAYYYPMSTSTSTKNSVRIYKNNTCTITAPEGVMFTKIDAVADNAATSFNIYTGVATSSCTITAAATTRIYELTITTGNAGDTPVDPTPTPTPTGVTVKKATEVAAGNVAFLFNEGYVCTFAESATYGYWIATSATLADEMTVAETAIFTIASTDNGYTITDKFGRIMGWNGTNWSFNAYTSASEGKSYWDIAMVDGKVKISNNANAGVYLCGKVYNSTYEMCPTDRADQTLPYLYKVTGDSSVAELVAEGDGEAVYYNLQGVKVAEPESGLYIKVQGGKSSKVLVRK